jgi:hypothetical protein
MVYYFTKIAKQIDESRFYTQSRIIRLIQFQSFEIVKFDYKY